MMRVFGSGGGGGLPQALGTGDSPTFAAITSVGNITSTGIVRSNLASINAFFIGSTSGGITWNGRGVIRTTADGVFQISNEAISDFGRLMFGGITSSFPALKRSGTGILVRLADDSADAPLTMAAANITGAFNHDGTTFGALNVTPAAQRPTVADPTGGAIIDAEARTAINAILVTLETFGFHATS